MSWSGRPLQIFPTMQDCAELSHAKLTQDKLPPLQATDSVVSALSLPPHLLTLAYPWTCEHYPKP